MATRTVDCTPRWLGILPLLLHLIHGTDEQRTTAEQQLERMAAAADRWNDHVNKTHTSSEAAQ